MRIGVILIHHDPSVDRPSHYVSKAMAHSICSERRVAQKSGIVIYTAEPVTPQLIWLKVDEPFVSIRERHKTSKACLVVIPRILPPRRPETLLIQYPHPEETSVLRKNSAFRRLCDEARIARES